MASAWKQTPKPLRGLFWTAVVFVALVIALVLLFALTPHAGL
jgi:hypothetical protein